jgi:hypothetical protein
MRRTNDGDNGTTGLSAALKGTTIVLAVGILALVAGRTAYTNNDGAAALPASMMPAPARDDAPVAGRFNSANSTMGILDQRILAASPAGVSAPEMQIQEAVKPTASPVQQEEPVATF